MAQFFFIHLALLILLSLCDNDCYAHKLTKNINEKLENGVISIKKHSNPSENTKSTENHTKPSGLREGHIVGGSLTYIEYFPFIVSVRLWGQHHCGGSLIRRNWVLTAAHCMHGQRGSDYWIWAGETDAAAYYLSNTAQVIQGERAYWHSGFVGEGAFWNDIAMIKTSQSFSMTDAVQLINIATYYDNGNLDVTRLSDYGTVIGWGDTRPQRRYGMGNQLRYVDLPLISFDRCRWSWDQLRWTQFCVIYARGGKSHCFGDSGGPLIWWSYGRYILQGIVSYNGGCDNSIPNVYTRVDQYADWINWHIEYRVGEMPENSNRKQTNGLLFIILIITYFLLH